MNAYNIVQIIGMVATVAANIVTLIFLLQTRKLLKGYRAHQREHREATPGARVLHTSSGTDARSGH